MAAGTGKARALIRAIPLVILDIVATGIAYIGAAWGTGVFGQILALGDFAQITLFIAAVNLIVFAIGHLYNVLWEYASIDEMVRIVAVVTLASIIADAAAALVFGQRLPWRVYGVAWVILICICGASRFAIRLYSGSKGWSLFGVTDKSGKPRTLIVGAGETGSLPYGILKTGQGNQLDLPGLFASSAQKMQTQLNRFSQFSGSIATDLSDFVASISLFATTMCSDSQKVAGPVLAPVSVVRVVSVSKVVG